MKTWVRQFKFLVVILGCSAAFAYAASVKTTTTNIPVTTVVHDYGANGVQLLTRSDDYNGSGQATYSTTCATSTTNCYRSWIANGDSWWLYLGNQSVRQICLTPNQAINSSQPLGPPSECTWQNIEVYSKCFDASGNIVSYPNVVTSSTNCSFGIDFYETATSTKYKLLMSPVLPAATCPSGGCPSTGLATVVCNALNGSGQCVNWSIAPNTLAPNATVANLYKYGRSGALIFIGQYHNTYSVGATNP
jgi:hypothetical protein